MLGAEKHSANEYKTQISIDTASYPVGCDYFFTTTSSIKNSPKSTAAKLAEECLNHCNQLSLMRYGLSQLRAEDGSSKSDLALMMHLSSNEALLSSKENVHILN